MFDDNNEDLLESSSDLQESKIVRVVSLYIVFLFTWQRIFRISDAEMGVLFFFSAFLTLLVTLFGLSNLRHFVKQLPVNIAQARKYIGHDRDRFTKYVSCPKCHYVNGQIIVNKNA